MKSNIWLCENCANDKSTLENMQRIVIPEMNGEISDAKLVIKEMCKPRMNGYVWGPHNKWILSFKKTIVDNMRAIRLFYKRFPELEKVTTIHLKSI